MPDLSTCRPAESSALFDRAHAAHRAGRLDDAERDYQTILARQPAHAHTLHWLGVLHHQQSRHERAAELIRAAARLRPDDPGIQLNFGNVQKALGALDQAMTSFRNALDLDPAFALAHYNLGNTYLALDRPQDAVDSYRRALRLAPGDAAIHNNLGDALNTLGRHQEASEALREALSRRPDYAGAHNNLGMALNGLGQPAAALQAFQAAVRLTPHFPAAHFNLGNTLDALGRAEQALGAFGAALALQPRFTAAWLGRGHALAGIGRHADAAAAFERAIGLEPRLAVAWLGLGAAHYAQGKFGAARRAFDEALRIRPDFVAARLNRAQLLLLQGDFTHGLAEYEWRLRFAPGAPCALPRWTGAADAAARRVLIQAEQGLGDTLQFVRLAPKVAALGHEVVLEVQPTLVPLLAPFAARHGARVLARGAARPEVDCHCPLLSLPLALNESYAALASWSAMSSKSATPLADNVPPYLSVPTDYQRKWSAPLPGGGRRKVGLAWSGNVQRNETRAVPLAMLIPLLRLDDIDWFALQTDWRDADRATHARLCPASFFIPGEPASGLPRLADFADTAALVEKLDAVVSIDTSAAHLAGALGKPLWLMLPFVPDWRWLVDGDISPWYPQARLVRQARPGDWRDVITRVCRAIKVLGDGRAPGFGERIRPCPI